MEVWENLGEIWHIDPDYKQPPEQSIKKELEAIFKQASIGCRSDALNPTVSARLWKVIALQDML